MKSKISLDCKTNHVGKDGTFPLLLRVTYNSKQIYINIGKSVEAKFYDKKKKCIKKEEKGASTYISYIERHANKIDDIIKEYERIGQVINLSKVRELYLFETGQINSQSFFDYVKPILENEKKLKLLKPKTLYNYENDMVKLKEYSPNLSIHDIDKTFLEKYESHILHTKNHSRNTKYHAMCFLRKYTKKLFKEGKIKKYPFDDYVVGKPELVEPMYLEPDELEKLHDLYDSKKLLTVVKTAKSKYARDFNIGEKYQEVLRYYLGSCYCGLRHSDIKTLKVSEIQGSRIIKQMKKGRKGVLKTVRIPITERFLSLLDLESENGLAFGVTVMENSQTNKYLKQIAKIAGINKSLRFHTARYSFAINSLILGMDLSSIKDVLGHSEIETTERYAIVTDLHKKNQMNKWNKFGKKESDNNEVEITCPNCTLFVMKFDRSVIKMNKIPCSCQNCKEDFVFSLTQAKVA